MGAEFFGESTEQQWQAAVARSPFASQNGKDKLRGGPLVEVKTSKKWTLLWREAHVQVKKSKLRGQATVGS